MSNVNVNVNVKKALKLNVNVKKRDCKKARKANININILFTIGIKKYKERHNSEFYISYTQTQQKFIFHQFRVIR